MHNSYITLTVLIKRRMVSIQIQVQLLSRTNTMYTYFIPLRQPLLPSSSKQSKQINMKTSELLFVMDLHQVSAKYRQNLRETSPETTCIHCKPT